MGIPMESDVEERVVTIDTPLYRARVTNRGACLLSLRLKNYRLHPDTPELVEMIPQPDGIAKYLEEEYSETDRAQKLSLLPSEVKKMWRPLAVRITGTEEGLEQNQIVFSLEAPSDASLFRLDGGEDVVLTFSHLDSTGLRQTKRVTFYADSYLQKVELDFTNDGDGPLLITPEMVVTEGYRAAGIPHSTRYNVASAVYGAVAKRYSLTLPDPGQRQRESVTGLQWAAMEDLYFFTGLLPRSPAGTVIAEQTVMGLPRILIQFDPLQIQPGMSAEMAVDAYLGPKEYDGLVEIGSDVDRIIDYGMFRILALPAIAILKFLNGIVHSFGFAIIILTLLLKVVTYPLNMAQYSSMNKMKLLAPELEKIKAKYKDAKDPQRYNQEMMQLYKVHGVNPAASCLPMFVQMPIFLALYSGLLYSIDLRQAPFLYIPDLSNPDPYFISPLLMGVSMLAQQRLSPSPADQSQATMMKVLPIVFTGIFLFAPAGLVIYWLMNNVLSIAQQYWMQKTGKA